MSDIFSTVIPVVAQTLDGGIMFSACLYLFETTFKNIWKSNSVGEAPLITKEKHQKLKQHYISL